MKKQQVDSEEVSRLLDEVGRIYLERSGTSSYARAVGYYVYLLWAVATGMVKPRDIQATLAKKIGQFNDGTEK